MKTKITDLIGNTPLVDIPGAEGVMILGKLEGKNPGCSVKDRIAEAMISSAEKAGSIAEGTEIIEPTSGNTGIGLALVCASRGYKLTVTMPDSMSIERRKMLAALGAKLVLTPAADGMGGAIKKAEELCAANKNSFMPQQFKNPANPEVHRKTTAEEIWADTKGKVDIIVAGVGTGGTLTGVGEALKAKKAGVKIVAVEPVESPVITQTKSGKEIQPGKHTIQGIGAGFIPEILNVDIIDEVITVKGPDAMETSRNLAKNSGIMVGISSGASAWAAIELSKRAENKDKTIVCILPDLGERYLSTVLFD